MALPPGVGIYWTAVPWLPGVKPWHSPRLLTVDRSIPHAFVNTMPFLWLSSLMPFQGVVLWIKVSVTRKMRYQRTIVPAPAIKIPNLERAKFYHSSPVFLHTYEIELSDMWHPKSPDTPWRPWGCLGWSLQCWELQADLCSDLKNKNLQHLL